MNPSAGADSPGQAERNGPPERRNQWYMEQGICPPPMQPNLQNGTLYHQHSNPFWPGQWTHRHPSPQFRNQHSRPTPQVFMQHQPFGNTGPHAPAGFYPLPPPAHIPRHFYFGTQRVASRRRNNRRHFSRNSSQDWDLPGHGGTVSYHQHLNHLNKSSDSRVKLGTGVKGKKKHHWRKRTMASCASVEPSVNGKRKGEENTNEENAAVMDQIPCLNGSYEDSDFLKSNPIGSCYNSDNGRFKSSVDEERNPICDRVQCDVRTDKSFLLSNYSEMRNNLECSEDKEDGWLEGAVGGVGISTKARETVSDPDVVISAKSKEDVSDPVYFLLDKDLVDEGAVCDLDGIFQNQECLKYNSQSQSLSCNSDEEHSDSSLSYTDKHISALSLEESESENGAYGGLALPAPFPSLSSHNSLTSTSSGNQFQASPYGGHEDWRINSQGQSNTGAMCSLVCNGDLVDSGGEDNGDFIDTDLPSCNKHILSSSDEMENISSDDGNEREDENRKPFLSKDPNLEEKFSKKNDLSTIQSRLLEDLDHLSLRGETFFNDNGFSAKHFTNSRSTDSSTNYDAKFQDRNLVYSEDAKETKYLSDNHDSDSENYNTVHSNESALLPSQTTRSSHKLNSDPVIHQQPLIGAAASALSHADKTSLPCHPGADCGSLPSVVQSQYLHQDSSSSSACNLSSSSRKDSFQQYIDNPALSASCEQWTPPFNQLGMSVIQNPASGPSYVEGSASCSHEHYGGPINDLNAFCHHDNGHLANGFSDDSNANFINDESNQHQKLFSKKSMDEEEEESSYSAASIDDKGVSSSMSESKGSVENDGDRCSEELLSPDSSDSVDMVLLPMEEDIEPVHCMANLYPSAGSGSGDEEDGVSFASFHSLASLVNNVQAVNSALSCDDCHCVCRDGPKPSSRLPSKEFYELIKSVSASDSYMRFFDKDGKDVQRSSLNATSDDEGTEPYNRLANSKADRLKVDRVMIWNEYEAYVVQFKQIAVSACGQTAVLNVMKALKFGCDKATVCKVIKTSLRKEDKDIPEYLFSRACAGTTATELREGVDKLSGGSVGGRFFHFWPPRKVKLLHWLAYWMKRGAIPVATMNLQQGPHSVWEIPDSWHHQMVYGVSDQGLYLTNPLEIVSERSAMNQLCSDSVLLVRRQDIISRFQETTDLSQLLDHPDSRWMSMNVLGQVVNVLRECNMPSVPGYRLQVTSHIAIPASYQAGIMLFMRKDKGAWSSLMAAPDLPLEESPPASA